MIYIKLLKKGKKKNVLNMYKIWFLIKIVLLF